MPQEKPRHKVFPLKLSLDTWQALRDLAYQRGVSLQRLIREAVEKEAKGC